MILELIERLGTEAGKRGMDFLLIGGQAMMHLGFQRFTLDVDFMGQEAAREAWEGILVSYGYALRARTPAFDQYIHATPGWPQVDVMFVNERTWAKLRGEAEQKAVGRLTLRVPSPRHMVALKLHSANSPRRSEPAKDWADIEALINIHHLDLSDPEFEKLVLQYGGEASMRRLKSEQS